jgi:hypothetical protein
MLARELCSQGIRQSARCIGLEVTVRVFAAEVLFSLKIKSLSNGYLPVLLPQFSSVTT